MALHKDLDVLKEIPGYKAILKSVLKSQIQMLMEQLASHTGEESIVLTASVDDGTLSHLGSNTGQGFLDGRDEIKTQFLGYCLKTHHKQKTEEANIPYQRTHPSPRTSSQQPSSVKRARFNPMARPTSVDLVGQPSDRDRQFQTSEDSNLSASGADMNIKQENVGNDQSDSSSAMNPAFTSPVFPSTVFLPHTQSGNESVNQSASQDSDSALNDNVTVKLEAVDEEDLEITGVEMGQGSEGHLGEGQMSFGAEGEGSSSQGDGFLGTGTDQATYSENANGQQFIKALFSNSVVVEQPSSDRYSCTECGRAFKARNDLRRHLLVHTGEKPFACPACDMKFRRKHHMQSHVIAKHPDKFPTI